MDDNEYRGKERRHNYSSKDIEDIKQGLYDSICADLGDAIIKKVFKMAWTAAIIVASWVAGIMSSGLFNGGCV